jgi:hypothetical protein
MKRSLSPAELANRHRQDQIAAAKDAEQFYGPVIEETGDAFGEYSPPKPVSNSIEDLARERKAAAIALDLAKHGETAADAEMMLASDEWWRMAAMLAGKRFPSRATRVLVVQKLRELEGLKK